MDVEKVIEAGARASRVLATPHADRDVPWEQAAQVERDVWLSHARACLTAALAEARAQGAVVPDEP